MLTFTRLLVLSPHTDDGELAAGGTISKFVEQAKEVYYIVFSSCEASLPANLPEDTLKIECQKATELLGIPAANLVLMDYEVRTFPSHRQKILEDMVKLNKEIKPDLVLIPSSDDLHQDHQTIHSESLRAFKKNSSIWGYEHPWNNLKFSTDVFVKLEERHMKRKVDALRQYQSQDFKAYFDEEYIKALAYTRGTQVDFTYAEAFELLRLLVK